MEEDNENGPSTSNSFQSWSQDGTSHVCRSGSKLNIDKSPEAAGRSDSARSNEHPGPKNIEQLASAAFGKTKRASKRAPRTPSNKPSTNQKKSGSKVMARTSKAKTGRVTKRRRRRPQRRRPKRRTVRYLSEDTIISSASYSGSEGPCDSCRHYACHRCFKESMSRESSKLLLSPLLVKSCEPVAETRASRHCEVSPEMITAALKTLAMWRAEVTTDMILNYIVANYPVCPDKTTLLQDLEEKLRISVITGMVCCSNQNTWSLAPALRRRLSTSHVTRFWEVHCDMAPVRRKVNREKKPEEDTKKSTEK